MQPPDLNLGLEDNGLVNSGGNAMMSQMAQGQLRMQLQRQPQPFQFSVVEHCGRIQQEFQYLERLYAAAKAEIQQLKDQKTEFQDLYQRSHGNLLKTSQENHKLNEMNHRLVKLINNVKSELPGEAQAFVRDQLESIRKVMTDDLRPQNVGVPPNPGVYAPVGMPQGAGSGQAQAQGPMVRTSEIDLSQEADGKSKKQKLNSSFGGPNFPPKEEKSPETRRLISGSPPPLYPVVVRKDIGNSGSEDENTKAKRKAGTPKNGSAPNTPNQTPMSPQQSQTGIPRTARMVATLPHNEVVCAVTVNGDANQVFTGGKGSVKLWDLSNATNKPLAELKCLQSAYIRSCKLANHNTNLIVAGETTSVSIWDLEGATPRLKTNLASPAQGYAIAVNDEEHSFYTCYSDGTIGAWDMNTGKQYRKFVGHVDGVSCIDISPDGQKLITGGLDSTIRVWDINTAKELASYNFPAQIFSVGICPGESWVAVGLANSHVEVLNLLNSNCKYQLHLHESCVLSLKFSYSGKWFITTGKDKLLNSWRSPFGASIFQCREPNSILCSDISSDDRLIVTGSGEQLATVYEVIY